MPLTVQQAINNILILRDHYARQQLAEDHAQKTIDDVAQAELFQKQINDIKTKFDAEHDNSRLDNDSRAKKKALKEQKKELDKLTRNSREELEKLEKIKLKPQRSTIRHHARLAVLDDLAVEAINISRAESGLPKQKLEQALGEAIHTIRESLFGKASTVAESLKEILHGLNLLHPHFNEDPINPKHGLGLGLRRSEEGTLQYVNMHIVNRAKEILSKYAETMDKRNKYSLFYWKRTSTAKLTAFQNIIGKINVILDEVKQRNGIVGYDVKAELLKIITEQTSEQKAGMREINEGKFSQRLDELQNFLEKITSLESALTRDQWLADELAASRRPNPSAEAAATVSAGPSSAGLDDTTRANLLDDLENLISTERTERSEDAGLRTPSPRQ